MEQKQIKNCRIIKSTFFSLVARSTELGEGLATIVLAARYLGVDQLGEYAFIRAIVIVLSFALPRIMILDIFINKECAANLVTSGLFLNIVQGIIVCYMSLLQKHMKPRCLCHIL